ncbi:N-acetyl sugar amidotransferase [Fibrobacterota bacterium]
MIDELRICSRCICDTTIPEIRFDEKGRCQYCLMHERMDEKYPLNDEGKTRLHQLVQKMKTDGGTNQYDCVVGVSGGRDSTYLLYLAVKLGLRPLAVHFDNGWNSEIAVRNIKNATDKLNVDLYTHVADWEEFKDLQLSFLKASVSDAEIPTDVAIFGTLHQAAAREGIKYILNGHSFRTEGIMPRGWTYMDGKYINAIQKKFGRKNLGSVPNFTLTDYLFYVILKGIKTVPLLNYFEYNQLHINEKLEHELGWQYYGGHHHESYYTHFFQSYLLPKKFNIDKRKIEYSALIRSGQMEREQALREIQETPYPHDEELLDYVLSKFGLGKSDFENILNSRVKTYQDYSTYLPLLNALRIPLAAASKLGMIPELLYLKFLG